MDYDELKSLRAADLPPPVDVADVKHKMEQKVENNKEAKKKEGTSWCTVFPYLIIVLLGLVLAYYAGNISEKELDKACSVNQSKWELCEMEVKKLSAKVTAYAGSKEKFQKLEKDCAVDRTKWADCKTKVKDLTDDVSSYQRLTNRLDKDLIAKEKELTNLKVECVKKEVLLDVKENQDKQDMDVKRDFVKNMQDEKFVQGTLKQRVEDCEKEIKELKGEKAKLEKRVRQLLSPGGKEDQQDDSNTTDDSGNI